MGFARTQPFGASAVIQGIWEVAPNKFIAWTRRSSSGGGTLPNDVWGSSDGGVTWSRLHTLNRTYDSSGVGTGLRAIRTVSEEHGVCLPLNNGDSASNEDDRVFRYYFWTGTSFDHTEYTPNQVEINNTVVDINGFEKFRLPDGSGRTISHFASGGSGTGLDRWALYRFVGNAYDNATAFARVNRISSPSYFSNGQSKDWQHDGTGRGPASAVAAELEVDSNSTNLSINSTSVPTNTLRGSWNAAGGPTLLLNVATSRTSAQLSEGNAMLFCDGSHIWIPLHLPGNLSATAYTGRLALMKVPYGATDATGATLVQLPNTITGQWRKVALWGRKLFAIVQTSSSAGRWIYYDLDTNTVDLMDSHADFDSQHVFRGSSEIYPYCPNWVIGENLGSYVYRMTVNQAPDTPRITSPSTGSSISHSQSLSLEHTFNDADMDDQSRKEIQRRVSGVSDYWTGSGWRSTQNASTQRASSSKTTNFTAAQWLKASTINNGAYPNHEFRIRVRDDNTDPAWSDWSDWISLTIIAAPSVGSIRFAGSSSTSQITVRNVFPELTWTANQQEEFIIQVWSESGGSRVSKVFEDRVVTTDKEYTLDVPLAWDGNAYQIGLNVIDFGVPAGYVWRRFRVSLPSVPSAPFRHALDPVNLSGTVVTPFRGYGIRARGAWANRSDDINKAQLRRRVVGDRGDGLLVADLTPTGSGPWEAEHTDWSVTSRVNYQYRWDVFTQAGVGSSSPWKS